MFKLKNTSLIGILNAVGLSEASPIRQGSPYGYPIAQKPNQRVKRRREKWV